MTRSARDKESGRRRGGSSPPTETITASKAKCTCKQSQDLCIVKLDYKQATQSPGVVQTCMAFLYRRTTVAPMKNQDDNGERWTSVNEADYGQGREFVPSSNPRRCPNKRNCLFFICEEKVASCFG
ncbi:hypothetical protein BaRGS_00030543 [Batillaria attramentaria]|uniref:Uncharacterized protein n=1 Tax=Batillaria attramentaria TaxID=370345 RepID=A0ABD0JTC0_9CAEN